MITVIEFTRPVIFFDTETTGPDPKSDRIVELGFVQIKPGEGVTREWQTFINPERPIPREATEGNPDKGYDGHGITDEMVKDAPTFKEWAPHLIKGFQGCDYGGFNIRSFDLPLLQSEFARAGITWSYEDARLLDGYRIWQLGEARTLSDGVEKFLGRKHDGAHRALDDVRASMLVIQAQLERWPHLPRDLEALHQLAYPKDPNRLDPEGKIRWDPEKRSAVFNFGKHRGTRLDLVPRDYFRWVLDKTDFSPAVKQICQDAYDGKFPTRETT